MKTKLESLVFFGSGPVAKACLDKLLINFNIECIVTKAKPIHHKDPAPIEEFAINHNIPIIFANNTLQLCEKINHNTSISSKIGIVIDYGVIIPKEVINTFEFGIVNSHFSLLPEWRGADPITYSILSGQAKTGVTLMLINEQLDTGDILIQESLPIEPNDNNQSLSNKLTNLSDDLINKHLSLYINGRIKPKKQKELPVTYSRKISKYDSQIVWDKPASIIQREIRAFSGWPKSHFTINNLQIIAISTKLSTIKLKTGEIFINDEQIVVGCRNGSLEITHLQPLGKKPMDAKSFINGYKTNLTI